MSGLRTSYATLVGTEHALDLSERIAELLSAELPNLDVSPAERAVAATALCVAAQRLDRLDDGSGRQAKLTGVTACLAGIGASWLGGLLR